MSKWIFSALSALLLLGIGTITDRLMHDGIQRDVVLFGAFVIAFYLLAKAQQHYIKRDK